MKLKILGSGSSGNCYILENDNEALIIEAGVSMKEVKIALNFNVKKIKCVIISHEHGDHRKYWYEYVRVGIPVFEPYKGEGECIEFTDSKFQVKAFSLEHDVPCYGFLITHPDMGRLIYASDTEFIKWRFKNINHFLVEANYCRELIPDDIEETKRQHIFLGHMEINTTCEFLKANKNADLRNVVLLHLSNDNANGALFKAKAEKVVDCPVCVARPRLTVDVSLTPF